MTKLPQSKRYPHALALTKRLPGLGPETQNSVSMSERFAVRRWPPGHTGGPAATREAVKPGECEIYQVEPQVLRASDESAGGGVLSVWECSGWGGI